MSFTLIMTVTAAVAATVGYLAARRKGEDRGGDEKNEKKRDDDEDGKDAAPEPKKPPAPAKKAPPSKKDEARAKLDEEKAKTAVFASLPLALGDVVSTAHEERWLAGALVAREDGRVIAALFLAPEGAKLTAVAAFAPPRKDIFWLSPVTLDTPDEPPATIELRGVPMRRKGRLPVTLERFGQGVPPVGEEAIWGVYEGGAGEVAVVIVSEGRAHAWSGRRLDEEQYDRLGQG
jgi:hypothetical protein